MIFELVNTIGSIIARAMFGMIQALVLIIIALFAQIIESKTFKSCVKLSRPLNSLMAAVFVAVVVLMAGLPDMTLILVASSVVVTITAAGNVINDYVDKDIDKINKPERPIPSRQIHEEIALLFGIILFITGLLMAGMLNPIALLIAAENSILLISYAVRLKKIGFIGNLVVSYLAGSTFLFAGAVVNTPHSWSIGAVLFVCAFFVTGGREIAKDMEDMKGDKSSGAKTLPIMLGMKKSSQIALTFLGIVVLLSPAPYFIGLFGIGYIPVIFAADAIFLYSGYILTKKPGKESAAKTQKLLKIGMLIALVAFIAGAGKLHDWIFSLV